MTGGASAASGPAGDAEPDGRGHHTVGTRARRAHRARGAGAGRSLGPRAANSAHRRRGTHGVAARRRFGPDGEGGGPAGRGLSAPRVPPLRRHGRPLPVRRRAAAAAPMGGDAAAVPQALAPDQDRTDRGAPRCALRGDLGDPARPGLSGTHVSRRRAGVGCLRQPVPRGPEGHLRPRADGTAGDAAGPSTSGRWTLGRRGKSGIGCARRRASPCAGPDVSCPSCWGRSSPLPRTTGVPGQRSDRRRGLRSQASGSSAIRRRTSSTVGAG